MEENVNPALNPGEQTSEYRLTKNALLAGLALIAVGAVLALGSAVFVTEVVRADSLQDLARVLIWAGVLLLTAPILGYQGARTLLKRVGAQFPATSLIMAEPVLAPAPTAAPEPEPSPKKKTTTKKKTTKKKTAAKK